jgi:hypothetical protein
VTSTLILDHLEALAPALQAFLVEVLSMYEDCPEMVHGAPALGVVALCNRPPEALIDADLLRADLLYRLQGARVVLPPLREDPAALGQTLIRLAREAAGGTVPISDDAAGRAAARSRRRICPRIFRPRRILRPRPPALTPVRPRPTSCRPCARRAGTFRPPRGGWASAVRPCTARSAAPASGVRAADRSDRPRLRHLSQGLRHACDTWRQRLVRAAMRAKNGGGNAVTKACMGGGRDDTVQGTTALDV